MPVTIPLPQEGLPSETEKNLVDCVISFIFRNYKKSKHSNQPIGQQLYQLIYV